jgi:DNA-binding CsgD family transcriptional regulator/GAF domain-containing protein
VHAVEPRAFTAGDAETLVATAAVLGLALERARLQSAQQLARQTARDALLRLEALQAVTHSAPAHISLDELLRELLARLRTLLRADHALLTLVAEDDGFAVRAADGEGAEALVGARLPPQSPISSAVLRERKALVLNRLPPPDDPAWPRPSALGEASPPRAAIAAPLRDGEDVVGALMVISRVPRAFTDDDLALLRVVADRVGPAVIGAGRLEHPLAVLTPRQRQILRLVAGGLTSKEVAQELGVSHRTVEAHRAEIMTRLDVHDLAALVRVAVRMGIVPHEP